MDAYRHHAFISYAWADDQPFDAGGPRDQREGRIPGGRNGWVSTFHDRFRKHLGMAIGRAQEGERIWLDYEQLRGSDVQQDMARDLAGGEPAPEIEAPAPAERSKPCDPPVPQIPGRHMILINGGSGDASLVQDIARTLAGCEGIGYLVPLMAQQGCAGYKPSELRRDLRASLKLATAVLMVVHRGPEDQIAEQAREYLQAATKRSEEAPSLSICHLSTRPLSFHVPGMRVHTVEDGNIADCACDFVRSLAS